MERNPPVIVWIILVLGMSFVFWRFGVQSTKEEIRIDWIDIVAPYQSQMDSLKLENDTLQCRIEYLKTELKVYKMVDSAVKTWKPRKVKTVWKDGSNRQGTQWMDIDNDGIQYYVIKDHKSPFKVTDSLTKNN